MKIHFRNRPKGYDAWRGPLRLVAVQPAFNGQEPPNGTSWACLHPDCIRQWGQHGLWGTAEGMGKHLASHPGRQPLALIYHPDNYVGDTPDAWQLVQTLADARDSGEPIMIDLRATNRAADATKPLLDGYRGVAYVTTADDYGRAVIVTADGQTIRLGSVPVRSIRPLLAGEAAALGLDGARERAGERG